MTNNYYNDQYFTSQIFDFDYKAIADAICDIYHPRSVIEFGCGNGDLCIALAENGVNVLAIDGYSTPDFSKYPNIEFQKIDLNNTEDVTNFLSARNQRFDVALSTEVAEHLNPTVSPSLIQNMVSVADVVVFSSAVLNQGGDGHINCRPREYWHRLFSDHNFLIADRIREKIRDNKRVARWYRHNIIDYCKIRSEISPGDYAQLLERLVASDSAASSDYYLTYMNMEYKTQLLNMQPMHLVFRLRNTLKKLFGKKALPLDRPEK